MSYLKLFLFGVLMTFQMTLAGQEICNNSVDDDGDGSIDLNDDECACLNLVPLTDVTGYICRDNLQLIMDYPSATSYQWYLDGVALTGETDGTLVLKEGPTVEGDYQVWIEAPDDCYLSEPYNVNIPKYEVDLGEENICEGDTVFFGGFSITFEGFFQVNGVAVDGCDSVTSLQVNIIQPTFGYINGQICEGQLFEFHDFSTTTPGIHEVVIPNTFGCDSIVTLDLTEGNLVETTIVEHICFGETYEYNDIIATTEGMYETLLNNPVGCDTLLKVDLQIDDLPIIEMTEVICKGDIFIYADISETESGDYETTLINNDGCDTIVNVNLTVQEQPVGYYQASICDGDTYILYDISETTTGLYETQIDFGGVCDSLIVVDLTVSDQVDLHKTFHLCEGETLEYYNIIESTEGTYSTFVNSASACDTSIVVDLFIHQASTHSFTKEICDGERFEYYDINETDAGIYETIIPNAFGCDSTITVELLIMPASSHEVEATICEGDGYEVNQHYYFEEGTYQEYLVSSTGCDSTVTLHLTVIPQPIGIRDETICEGETFQYGSIHVDAEGIYDTYVEGPNGCDSLVSIQLFINEKAEGVELAAYQKVEYNMPTDIEPYFMGEGVSNIIWSDDDGEELGEGPILEDFKTTNDMYINLQAIDGNGCLVEARTYLDVEIVIDVFIPNIFSPDGDGQNDQFQIFGGRLVEGIQEMQIFDRWGELVFKDENQPATEEYYGWDGNFRGKTAVNGVYTYIVVLDLVTGATETKTGTITLLR